MKFGSTNKQQVFQSYTATTTLSSDQLGEVIVNFADPILLSEENAHVVTTGNRSDRFLNQIIIINTLHLIIGYKYPLKKLTDGRFINMSIIWLGRRS